MQTKNAMGNLKKCYTAVLKKCRLINTFGSLAVASMLAMGSVSEAMGAGLVIDDNITNGAITLDITQNDITTSPFTNPKNITLLAPDGTSGAVTINNATLGDSSSTDDLTAFIGAGLELNMGNFNIISGVPGYISPDQADTFVTLQTGTIINANMVTLKGNSEFYAKYDSEESIALLDLRKGLLRANSITLENGGIFFVNSTPDGDIGNIELSPTGTFKLIGVDDPFDEDEGYGGFLLANGDLDFTKQDSLLRRLRLSTHSEIFADGTVTFSAEDIAVGENNIFQDFSTGLGANQIEATADSEGKLRVGIDLGVVDASNNLGLKATDEIIVEKGGSMDFGHSDPPGDEFYTIAGIPYIEAKGDIQSTLTIAPPIKQWTNQAA